MSFDNISEKISTEEAAIFRKKMLDWYDRHRRTLPWRALPHETPNPYHVWLSEIMLQQTTVPAVIPYFEKFTQKWPCIHDLATAKAEEIMNSWAGLGYYARARNLHKCARIVSEQHNGRFPDTLEELKPLPGIGDYTSAAILSIAFNCPSVVVDGNVERVMARYHACNEPLPNAKKTLRKLASQYAEGFDDRPADYAQALMDLGATICTPKSPACALCPLNDTCLAYKKEQPDQYPKRSSKKPKPKRQGYVYWITNEQGDILLEKRPDSGLLGGMYGLPTTVWSGPDTKTTHLDWLKHAKIIPKNTTIEHVFTHFNLRLYLYEARISGSSNVMPENHEWINNTKLDIIGFPTVFNKAVTLFTS